MSAPIQEPTESRTTSGLGYGQRQLFRRPAPASDAGAGVEWGRANAEITTSAIDYVEPDFDSGTDHTFERTVGGRWQINGSGRFTLEAGNPGTYILAVNIFDAEGDSGSDTYAKILLNPVAPVPAGYWVIPGWYDTGADASAFEITFPLMLDATSTFFDLTSSPWTQVVYLDNSDEDLVWRIRAAMIKDSNFESGNSMNIIISMVRIGDATLAVETGPPFS